MSYNLKSEEEVKEYVKNLGIEYRFGCYSENNPEACHLLGDYLEAIKKDFVKASKVYQTNCDDRNYGKSCYKFAGYIALGKGDVKSDIKKAHDYFDKACNLEQPNACFHQGLMLISSSDEKAVPKDIQKGVSLLEKACNAKDALACFYLSGLYINGMKRKDKKTYDVPKDMEKAFTFATESCHLGNMYSCANVSQMYAKGDGVKADPELAQKYKDIAAEMQKEVHETKTLTFQEGLS